MRIFDYIASFGLSAVRGIRALFLVLLFYLVQVSVMPYVKLFGIVPNILMVLIAILTVSYGKKYAFASSALFGIILEAMARNISSFYVIVYPTLALLFAQVFADMSDIQRELRRINLAKSQEARHESVLGMGKPRRFVLRFRRTSPDDMNPHVRIVLNTACLVASYELIMLFYVIMNGYPLLFSHFRDAFYTVAYSCALCVLMFPVRAFLGMYGKKKKTGIGDEVSINPETQTDLSDIALLPDMPSPDALQGFIKRSQGERVVIDAVPAQNPCMQDDEGGDKE